MASHQNRHMFFFISPLICGLAASILFHLKHKRTSSSSSTSTCPPDSAPPSSSSVDPEKKYDVFLSFRGTDTRSGFLSHLLKELSQKKIEYFVDDQKLKQGDEISSTLLDAIKKSEISLVVFSKDYANSKWCLEELEQIIQCMDNQKQIVVPIFYKVDPSTVQHQKGSYKNAFDKLGKRFGKDRLQKWQIALKKASDLSGFDSSSYFTEATLIKEVVERVLTELNQTGDQNDLKVFVGIHKHIQYLETRLCIESQDISTIGIWGMGGIGKTTIAEILYYRLYDKYEGSHFLRVKEELDKHGSILQLKKDLLSELLDEDLYDVMLIDMPTYAKRRLSRKRVLVVIDDISDLNQLEILTGRNEWFGPGSRIILTSRDKHVLSKDCDEVYLVEPLNSKDALQLFENVLRKDYFAKKQECREFLKKAVKYAQGVPLAIKVLGGYLSGAKSEDEWKSKLEKLEKMPDSRIQAILELSYNGLDEEHKSIFLYLVCFFRYESKERIIFLLDACGYHTIDGLRVLLDKALIIISRRGIVSMHDLIEDMGCETVRKKSRNHPGQRSHLCDPDDIYKVFKNEMGTGTIESIRLNNMRLKKDIQLGPQAFVGMENLRLLHFYKDWRSENRYIVYPPPKDLISESRYTVCPPKDGFESLPNELRYFYWTGYPSNSFPLRSCGDNLVELHFKWSKLRRLWDGVQDLPSLKVIDLSFSRELIEVPDLSRAPSLERVNLSYCIMLNHVGLWPNHNMAELDSTECEERKKNSLGSQVSSTSLSAGASEEDDHLDLCRTPFPIKPSFKYDFFSSLQFLNLSVCYSLTELPDNIGVCLPSLQKLGLWDTNVETLPASIKHLSQLKSIDLGGCSRLRYIPEFPPSLEYLTASNCRSLETLQFASNSMPLSHQKHRLYIQLYNSVKLDDHRLEDVARHYKLTTQRIISASIKDGYARLYFPGNKIPECFSSYRATQDSVSIPLELPLHSKAMGFIFYFVLLQNKSKSFQPKTKCHIELSNVPKVQFIYHPTVMGVLSGNNIRDHVFFGYESYLSLKIMKKVSKMKASTTTDDLYARVWFELLDFESNCHSVKEWGVYPIFISSEPQDHRRFDEFEHYDNDVDDEFERNDNDVIDISCDDDDDDWWKTR